MATPTRPRRVDQLVNSFTAHDAVSSHMRSIQELVAGHGLTGEIFAEQVLGTGSGAKPFREFAALDRADGMILYHHSIGNGIPKYLLGSPAYKVVIYHNVTPASYFKTMNEPAFHEACSEGIRQLPLLAAVADEVWTVSRYNAEELARCAFPEASVFPLLRSYERLSQEPADAALDAALRTRPNLLFVGRLTPHKGQHDAMRFLRDVKARLPVAPRLVLVGGNLPIYLDALRTWAKTLGLVLWEGTDPLPPPEADVWVTGTLPDRLLAACYRQAAAFLSLSEHEGFCVPLVEAMFFGLPIVAHAAAAIPETLGGAGVLFDKAREWESGLAQVQAILTSPTRAEECGRGVKARARAFERPGLEARFQEVFAQCLARYAARPIPAPLLPEGFPA